MLLIGDYSLENLDQKIGGTIYIQQIQSRRNTRSYLHLHTRTLDVLSHGCSKYMKLITRFSAILQEIALTLMNIKRT